MKFKSKKRQDRAARRDGVCKHCAPVADYKLPVGARGNVVTHPCAKCGRVLVVAIDVLSNPLHQDLLRAFIQCATPEKDVCTAAFHRIMEGEPVPEVPPHEGCERPHMLFVVVVRETKNHAPASA